MPDGSSASSPTIRGVVLHGLLDWVRREHGDPGVRRVIDTLPEDVQHHYEGSRPKFVATTPIPGHELAQIARAIIDAWGLPAYHAAAAHVAISDLNGYMKLFLKVGTPTFVLRRLPRVLAHYCNVGELTIERSEPGSASVRIRDVEAFGPAVSEGAVGWIRAALELSGARNLQIETRHSPGTSRYELRWR